MGVSIKLLDLFARHREEAAPAQLSPREQGYQAAKRIFPKNPHQPGTAEHDEWQAGLDSGWWSAQW